MSSRNNDPELLSTLLKQRIIDAILKSELNMEDVPDDLERKLYENILDVLELELQNGNCNSLCQKIFCCK